MDEIFRYYVDLYDKEKVLRTGLEKDGPKLDMAEAKGILTEGLIGKLIEQPDQPRFRLAVYLHSVSHYETEGPCLYEEVLMKGIPQNMDVFRQVDFDVMNAMSQGLLDERMRMQLMVYSPFQLIYLFSPTIDACKEMIEIYMRYHDISLQSSVLSKFVENCIHQKDTEMYEHLYANMAKEKIYTLLVESIRAMHQFVHDKPYYLQLLPFLSISYRICGPEYRMKMHILIMSLLKSRRDDFIRPLYEEIFLFSFEEKSRENLIVLLDLCEGLNAQEMRRSYIFQVCRDYCKRYEDEVNLLLDEEMYFDKYIWFFLGISMGEEASYEKRGRRARGGGGGTIGNLSLYRRVICSLERRPPTFFQLFLQKVLSTRSNPAGGKEIYVILGETILKSDLLSSYMKESDWTEMHMCLLRMDVRKEIDEEEEEENQNRMVRWVRRMRTHVPRVVSGLFQKSLTCYLYIDMGYYRALQEILMDDSLENLDKEWLYTLLTRMLNIPDKTHAWKQFLEYILERHPDAQKMNWFNLLMGSAMKTDDYQHLYENRVIRRSMEKYVERMRPKMGRVEGGFYQTIQLESYHCVFCEKHFDARGNTECYQCVECEYTVHDTCLFQAMREMRSEEPVSICIFCKKKSMKRVAWTYDERKYLFYRLFLNRGSV